MDIDLSKIKKVFFVGIGGIGISAIARMLKDEGKDVSGSDMTESAVTHELREIGIDISIGQSFDLIPADADLIVYTIAIKHYDPALMERIYEAGIPAKSYPEMLHIVTSGKYTIAVSGTHGKTTTTAMIAKILVDTGRDPSVIVGSFLKNPKAAAGEAGQAPTNLIIGKSEYFVVEACEYERSFLNIEPKVLVITNIEADHLDYYKDLADIEHAFAEMAMQTSLAVVCDPSDPSVARVLAAQPVTSVLKIVDYTKYIDALPKLAVAGVHNRKNAAAAVAVAEFVGVPAEDAGKAVAQFQGTWRRMELKGTSASGATVYDGDQSEHRGSARNVSRGREEAHHHIPAASLLAHQGALRRVRDRLRWRRCRALPADLLRARRGRPDRLEPEARRRSGAACAGHGGFRGFRRGGGFCKGCEVWNVRRRGHYGRGGGL